MDFSNVRYAPSKMRPRRVVADVDTTLFIGESYPAAPARLEIEFILREGWDFYWIQWIEPDRNFTCGWHQDSTHTDLGNCHFQIEREDGSIEREPATFLDAHPLYVFETRLAALPGKLRSIDGS